MATPENPSAITPSADSRTGERIEDVDVSAEMQGSFLEYAYSVIYSRALPDARDGGRLRLNLPRRTKKRLPVRLRQPLVVGPHPNAVWAVDFMSDTLDCGRRFRTFNVLDEGVREGLAIEIDTSLPAERVIRVLEQVVSWRGQPQAIRLDNGPEFIAERFLTWCAERAIQLWHIQPGKPDQNALIERYNRTYRTEVLKAYVFESLEQVREISAEWLQSYNEERPHDALGGLPPATYRAQVEARNSPMKLSP